MYDISSMNFISNEDFCAQRPNLLREMIALKSIRRVALGPDMSVLFEHPKLVWWHIQEMLRIEQGGESQLQEEWSVYHLMVPSPDFLTVTLMIEINDPIVRKKVLRACIGIEKHVFLEGAGFRIASEPIPIGEEISPRASGVKEEGPQPTSNKEQDQNPELLKNSRGAEGGRTLSDSDAYKGFLDKTSSVHFLRFPVNQSIRHAFSMGEPVLSCQHPAALHRTPISNVLWSGLCQDMGIVPFNR